MTPVAVLIPEQTIYGTVYLPGNLVAVQLAGIAGTRRIPEERLPYIRALGIEVVLSNGQPIPHPKRVDVVA
jgi:hypothetical protein